MSYEILFKQALEMHERGDLLNAEKNYRKILEASPENPDILNLLGLIAQAKSVHIEAINLFYQAIKNAPTHAPFYFNLAISLETWGKPYEAIDAYKNALKYKPDIPEAYLNLANIYLSLNDKAKAIENFEKTLEINPSYAEAKANILFLEKNTEKLEALKEDFSKEPSIYYFLSKLYQEKDIQEAIENINLAYALLPESDIISFQRGYLNLLSEKESNAKECFEKTLSLNARHIEAMINLANIETNQKNYAKAETLYKRAIEIEPKNLNAHLNFATLLYLEKKLPQALEEYRQAVILNPEIPEISNNIGLILKDLNEFEDALGLFFNAFYKNPERSEFSLNIIETLYLLSLKDKEKAIKISENWLKTSPENLFAKQSNAFLTGTFENLDSKYNEFLFDNFAQRYESTLKNINYSIISKIIELNLDVRGKVLDMGCGSGLLGKEIKTDANQLFGVDISEEMLKLAKEKKVYTELSKQDILSFLKENNNFDWFFALDVFNYIGDISEIISHCKGKNLCFSIETSENTEKNYILTESGRIKHNPDYIESILEENNFKIIRKEKADLRLENNVSVQGLIYVCE